MKKAVIMSAALLALLKAGEIKAEAWFKKTHINIVEQAFEILKNDGKSKDVKQIYSYLNLLVYGATVPDVKGDCDNGKGLHYYSPINTFGLPNRKNGLYYPNRLGGYTKSAGTMLEENYTMALILWQNRRFGDAAVMLGRALHFLGDLCCVPHSTSKKCTGNPKNCHLAFETAAGRLTGVFNAQTSKKLYDSYLELSPIELANVLAQMSSGFYDMLANKDKEDYNQVIAGALPFSQMAAAAFIYKFSKEASEGVLLDKTKLYSIRNLASGLYLSSSGYLDREEDAFSIKFFGDRTVGFTDSCDAPLVIGAKHSRFRLTLRDGNINSFRITCGRKFSLCLAEVPVVRRCAPAFFKPQSELNCWVIREVNDDQTAFERTD